MANRKPLVLGDDALPQQLQAGDTLAATVSGGAQQSLTNNEIGAVVICTPVYSNAAAGFKKAQANAIGTKDVIGLAAKDPSIANGATGPVQIDGPLTATTAQWDAVTGGSGGLIFDQRYWLDPTTAGKLITTTPPSTVGQYLVEVGIALSPTTMKIDVKDPILL